MSNVNAQVSHAGSGTQAAGTTVTPGNTAVSSKGAQHVVPSNASTPKRVFELPSGDLRVDQ